MAEPLERFSIGLAERLGRPAQLLGWRTLRGASGRRYAFGVLDAAGELPRAGAVYCLARRTAHANGIRRTELLGIGQTGDLGGLEMQRPAAGQPPRANAVCILLEDNEFQRRLILRDLTAEPGFALSDPSARRRPR